MRKDVQFYSEGKLIAAHLYLPDTEAENLPAIVLCHGFAGFKELLLPSFGEAFSKAGFAALTFDYRGFGDSEGEPGNLDPVNQVKDIRNAITYIKSLPEVDGERIGLWGTSYGGANAITTARQDNRVKCLVVQLTFGSGERVITGSMTEQEKEKLLASLEKSWTKAVTNNRVMMLSPSQILSDEQSKAFYNEMVEKFPKLATRLPILTIKRTIEYNPEEYISEVKVPVFILAAGKDGVNPPGESQMLFDKANEPKELYSIEEATHYQVYDGEYFGEAVENQIRWFNKYL